jgi:hypothetical protein
MRIRCPHCKARLNLPPNRPRRAGACASCPACKLPIALGEATAVALAETVIPAPEVNPGDVVLLETVPRLAAPPPARKRLHYSKWLLLCLVGSALFVVLLVGLQHLHRPPATPVDEFQNGLLNDGDLRIRLEYARLGLVRVKPLFDPERLSGEPHVSFCFRAWNLSQSRIINYDGWGCSFDRLHGCPDLHDDIGNRYPMLYPNPDRPRSSSDRLRPGDSSFALLVFERPVPAAKTLTLRLPKPGSKMLEPSYYILSIDVADLERIDRDPP